ncbi:MaoC family dehydratase [Ferrimonas sediminum]|uniref:MaoC family dehydratase n=1 Tax=Ferrimonas sediminum TaxID=718193 RepID=UPI00159FAE8D|nr:MaoC/PaaZ C-terminal domain-containing protein [Ferrimonas sediminum]
MLQYHANQIPASIPLIARAIMKRAVPAELPEKAIEITGFRFDQSKLEKYNAFCGFASGSLPLSYLFVATQPVQLMLLIQRDVPVKPLGMIHLGVSFELLQPLSLEQEYDFTLKVGDQQETIKGLEFELIGEFYLAGQCVARYVSRCLLKLDGPRKRGRPTREPKIAYDWKAIGQIALEEADARRYASISGDYNPIHLHRLTAKPFGFDAPIAHGMYLVAKMLASVNEPLTQASFQFQRPVLMPCTGTIERDGEGLRLANEAGKALVAAKIS